MPNNEKDLDSFVNELASLISKEESNPSVLSLRKYRQVEFVYECMRYLMQNTDAEVSYKLFEPLKTMAYVSVESDSIEITDTLWFSRAAEFASNVEVYPLTSGKVRMTFTFHNITNIVE